MEFEELSWDQYFRGQLQGIAKKSKDPSRKIGAIAVRNEHVVMTGFNGFPRGVNDRIAERYARGRKNLHTLHAEANIVSIAANEGVSLKNTTMYCNLYPCVICANLMINAGVKRVVCPPLVLEPEGQEIYHFDLAEEVMLEAGIEICEVSDEDGRHQAGA